MKDGSKKHGDWVKGLNKLFNSIDDNETDTIPEDERKGYLDPSQVAMIIPKTRQFKDLLLNTFEVKEDRVPHIEYFGENSYPGGTYSPYYLKIFSHLMKNYDVVEITTAQDKPMTLETEDFIMLIAPRIVN